MSTLVGEWLDYRFQETSASADKVRLIDEYDDERQESAAAAAPGLAC